MILSETEKQKRKLTSPMASFIETCTLEEEANELCFVNIYIYKLSLLKRFIHRLSKV